MSASFSPALPAIAFQLAAAIEDYQIAFEAIVAGERTRHAFARASALLTPIRRLRGAIPALSGDVLELLIGHMEVLRSIREAPAADAGPRAERVARHERTLARMHRKCVALFSRN
jgi:hypothetical protein